jgi:alpha-tubulin suppressor-like RCC1 family protein
VTNVLALAAGTWHTLALLEDGSVRAWGDNSSGQSQVPSGLSGLIAIAARGNHNLAFHSDGSVVAWGDNTDFDGFFSGQSIVPGDLTNAVSIAAGDFHSVAARRDGTLASWGNNSFEQCNPPQGVSAPAMIVGGREHNIALALNGVATAWGDNSYGQCNLPSGLSGIVAVAAGAHHTLALFDSHSIKPRLFGAAWSQGGFKTRVQTQARKNYVFEYKNSVTGSTWSALSTNRGNGALLLMTDPTAPQTQRFYRIQEF